MCGSAGGAPAVALEEDEEHEQGSMWNFIGARQFGRNKRSSFEV
jgi:hypothetical protein